MENQEGVQAPAVKFCPICGDTMQKQTRDGGLWWVCGDQGCDFQILVKSAYNMAAEEGSVS
ncbi:hypothetical protein [Aeromonas sp.]|uniref:hypothetical protein n=1 Tax=Aeromonas sp. TaxID=647 RepID=UPI002586A38C|nr:hypothetical protein [Aeromonas sp.]MCX7132256.1 hypothetical protein [Aeromonas sp.]